ncbi:hypothetical protein HYQ46_000675 [Verticillium longisporum]|nr:hypothetical protein HYQ44_001092 [Verticillium longisporum]KAG7150382.1 hypothetical protein HYQ46_000675 [Verticillium longisporum]
MVTDRTGWCFCDTVSDIEDSNMVSLYNVLYYTTMHFAAAHESCIMELTMTGLFERLPNELIILVADLLLITDVLSLQRAIHKLLSVLDQRIDPAAHVPPAGRTFQRER